MAYGLASGGVDKLFVADLDESRAEALAESINATPMGMALHPGTAFDTSCLSAMHWVSDVVYMPLETELLRVATELGCRTFDGSRKTVY